MDHDGQADEAQVEAEVAAPTPKGSKISYEQYKIITDAVVIYLQHEEEKKEGTSH